MVEFDFSLLTGRIITVFGSRQAFAEAVGISKGTLSMKLNNRSKITMPEIMKWTELLGIDPADIGLYFFTPKVR